MPAATDRKMVLGVPAFTMRCAGAKRVEITACVQAVVQAPNWSSGVDVSSV